MNILDHAPLALHNFEGPLDYLVHLVLRGEIDIAEIPLLLMTEQFVEKHLESTENTLDIGAEFVGSAATLLWLKSKKLLPSQNGPEELISSEDDPRFEIIHQLVEYCRFKKAAQELAVKEASQKECHYRPVTVWETAPQQQHDLISLEDLTQLFSTLLQRAATRTGKVYEERFRVADAMTALHNRLKVDEKIPLLSLFLPSMCRDEVVVLFLAILELMKSGAIHVVRKDVNELEIVRKSL